MCKRTLIIADKHFTALASVIGGSGFYQLRDDAEVDTWQVDTPYSASPVSLFKESICCRGKKVNLCFIPRHGKNHSIPPHQINYRANLWALKQAGVKSIIAVNAVGGINPEMGPGTLVLPDQIIDYTWGREHTFYDGLNSAVTLFDSHVDFTWPYDQSLRQIIQAAAQSLGLHVKRKGVYACTQGPRLETAAEIIKLRNDGADIVGMTGMPEAVLARELGMAYVSLAVVVNWGAGLTSAEIGMDKIMATLEAGLDDVRRLLLTSLEQVYSESFGLGN